MGVLIAFVGLVGMVGSVAQNAEVMRLSIAGGLVSLLMCGNMLNEIGHDIQAECGLAAFNSRLQSLENVIQGRSEPEMFAQIMSRMHELDNGISILDKKSDDVQNIRMEKVYMKHEKQRDENFLRERLDILEAHVHHLLNDPIVITYEKSYKTGNSTDTSDPTQKEPIVRKTINGEDCIFPVVYRGEVHTDCVNIGDKPMCRTSRKTWAECEPLEDRDEFADPITVLDPKDLEALERTVDQLKAVSEFLEDMDDITNLSQGDMHYLINILKDAHVNFESSKLNVLLQQERLDYSGGEKGKEELMKHLATELIEKQGDSELKLQRLQNKDYGVRDDRSQYARRAANGSSSKKRRQNFHKKFNRYMKNMTTNRGRIGLADMPEHCIKSTQFKDTFAKITFALLLVQALYTYAALSSIFEVDSPKLEHKDSLY